MAIQVRVSGAAELKKVAAQIRREGNKDLSRDMSRALSRSVEPVKVSIRQSAAETMPTRGGYSPVFLKSLRFRQKKSGSGNSASLSLITYAEGKQERRDIVSLERGRLRHPVFGRSSKNRRAHPWATTNIRAGFHRRGSDNAADQAEKEILKVVDDFARRLI